MTGHKLTVRRAFYKTVPIMAGYIVLGMGFGILLRNAGYGVLWALSMSLLYDFQSAEYKRKAARWCEDNGIEYEET